MSLASSTSPSLAKRRQSLVRRASGALHRRPRLRLGLLLTGPLLWLVVAYIGSLVALLVTSFRPSDSQTAGGFTAQNVIDVTKHAYPAVARRTVGVAAAVTLIDLVLALPVVFYMAKLATRRVRRLLVVAVLMPLWASYVVKGYAWRTLLDPAGGVLRKTFKATPGYGLSATVIVLAYLWLPYMILPIYAGLERLPDSLLEASADLGGKAGVTVRAVVLPLLLPAIVAGSIFTFSLSLGDYITVGLVGGKTQMIGNVISRNFGANNVSFAAAFATVPVVIMVVYLLAARRTGAFENL